MTATGDILQMALEQMEVPVAPSTEHYIQEVQTLCSKLAEIGEETLFISVNLSGNQCAYLGSTFGKEYIEKNDTIQGFFQFCCGVTYTLYTTIPHEKLKLRLADIIKGAFFHMNDKYSAPSGQKPSADTSQGVCSTGNELTGQSLGLVESKITEIPGNVIKNLLERQVESRVKETTNKNNDRTVASEMPQTSDQVRHNLQTEDVINSSSTSGTHSNTVSASEMTGVSTLSTSVKEENDSNVQNDRRNNSEQESINLNVEQVQQTGEPDDDKKSIEEEREDCLEPRNTRQMGRRTGKKTAARPKALEKTKADFEVQENKVTEAESTPKIKQEFHMRTRSGGKVKHLPWLQKSQKESGSDTDSSSKATKQKTAEEHKQSPGKRSKKVSTAKIESGTVVQEDSEVMSTGEQDAMTSDVVEVEKQDCGTSPEQETEQKFTIKMEESVKNNSAKTENKICGVCNKEFPTAKSLRMHSKTHAEGQFICLTCQQVFNLERMLRRHMQEAHPDTAVRCEECKELFQNSEILDVHLLQAHNTEKVYTCTKCPDLTITGIQKFKDHIKTHLPKYTCDVCGKVCLKSHELKLHMRKHTQEKPYKCKVCDRGFARTGTLYMHSLTHRDYKAFQCEICGRCFKIKESLRQHRRVHIKESIFCCEYCDQKFRTFDGRKNHVVQFHKDLKDNPQWKVYTCEYCKKSFGAKQQYIRHLSVHTGNRPHTCDKCGKGYPTLSALNTHKKSHIDQKPFQCLICGLSFNVYSKMKRHIETQKHIQLCSGYGVDPNGNLEEYEEKLASEGKLRKPDSSGGVRVPVDGVTPVAVKKEGETTEVVETVDTMDAEELVECVLIHIPENTHELDGDGQTNIVYSINTEDGTIHHVFEEKVEMETS